jgi:ribosomal protein L23
MFNQAVDSKVSIHVEKALIEQDESHASKLQQLLESIDDDHSLKLQKVVEAIDKNHSQKLVQLVKKYENSLNNEASSFKQSLVESISSYIDEYIDEKIPVSDVAEAVRNKKATAVLESLRTTLGVDYALSKNTIKHAIQEGKEAIDHSHEKISTLTEHNQLLADKVSSLSSQILLNEKTSSLPEEKRNYIFKVLGDKDEQFITENFDYTVRLFDKTEQDRLSELKEEAISKRPVEVDRPIVESVAKPKQDNQSSNSISSPFANDIMSELSKF